MFFDLVKTKPVLDEVSALWMFDTFAWALQYFDAEVFFQEIRDKRLVCQRHFIQRSGFPQSFLPF